MRKYELSLYEYCELDEEAKNKVVDEFYYNDGDFLISETDDLFDMYISIFKNELDLELDRNDLDYDTDYDITIDLVSREDEKNPLWYAHNAQILENYVNNHITSKRLKVLLNSYDVGYYWNNHTERIEVCSVDCIDGRWYTHCENYLEKVLPEILQPVSDKINEIIGDFYHDLYNLEYNIREYLSDSEINIYMNDCGFMFTSDGTFVTEYERDEIENNLDTLEKAYGTKFEIKED